MRSMAAQWSGLSSNGRVLIGFDTRFASESLAMTAAEVLAEAGLKPILSRSAIPTPVLTHAVARRRVLGGMMLTASHNAPLDHGLKLFGSTGGAFSDGHARDLEKSFSRQSDRAPLPGPPAVRMDWTKSYLANLRRILDEERLERSRLRLIYDAMHGSGADVLIDLLAPTGIRMDPLRARPDPLFGGQSPDPIPAHLGELAAQMAAVRTVNALGLATDGDADRLAVVLPGGRFLSDTEMVALLVDYLASTGRLTGTVAVTGATGSLVDQVAEHRGLGIRRTRIGFKHLAPLLETGEAQIAGDESGGFGWSAMGLDKDGLLAAALFCEMAVSTRGGVRSRFDALQRRHGASLCGRRALGLTPEMEASLRALRKRTPARFDELRIQAVDGRDGLRLQLEDGFIMWRISGTENVLRLYAEAPTRRRLARRLALGERLVDRDSPRPSRPRSR